MKKYEAYSLTELEQLQELWEVKEESEEEEDFRQKWVEEGIDIFEALLRKKVGNEKKSMYYHNLAKLYLEFGRSEKMIQGNDDKAFKSLQRAARYLPEKGNTFYHLAFLAEKMTMGKEKWESAAFYAKEALERGINTEKQIKIWCLLGKAYLELGFRKDAANCFSRSKNLDQNDDFARFRAKYSKGTNEETSFMRLNPDGTKMSRRDQREWLIEKSQRGECYVLVIDRRGSTLYGNGSIIPLKMKEAELLRLLFEWNEGLTKDDIIRNTVSSLEDKKAESVKTDISRLRALIKKHLGVDGKFLIQVIDDPDRDKRKKYIWNPKIEKHLFGS